MNTVLLNGEEYAAPFRDRYRPLTPDELDALRSSVRADGVIEPVVLYVSPTHGKSVLDGVNRIEVANELGQIVPTIKLGELPDDRAATLADSLQEGRRSLTPEEIRAARAARVQRVAEMRAGGMSLRAIAGEEGVSHTTIKDDLKMAYSDEEVGGTDPEKIEGIDGRSYSARRNSILADAVPCMSTGKGFPVDMSRQAGSDRPSPSSIDPPPTDPTLPEPPAPPVQDPDAAGQPIGAHAEAAFAARPLFEALLAHLRKARRLWADLCDHPGGAYLIRPGVSYSTRNGWRHKGIETALLNLADCEPANAVCPRAPHDQMHGPECPLCQGLNWSPK
ncbi:hypothetical protein [Fimbriiglobus ruber]|uniref:ParB/Sulfiredoxin domain-containing protein n=1 Tax=Fimbriiglobus ruber TaxID=1908690 RepID=A0A225DWW1_9BACT|nr:hypothetical protein [Fimbriiglobus ruber]OWK45831.1 hypothetical protein FRUB_02162 [Fimbriiglobus ruber]